MADSLHSPRNVRAAFADLARRYRSGSLPYEQFLRQLPRNADRDDEAIAELLDLIVEASTRQGRADEHETELWRNIDLRIEALAGSPEPADAPN